MNNIIWKDILGYEDYYEINNNGEVWSKERKVPDKRLGTRRINRRKLNTSIKRGYVVYQLWKDGICKNYGAHRLLAIAFIDNILNKTDVNHKNGIRNDNRIENLEWVTRSENVQHGYDSNGRKVSIETRLKMSKSRTGKKWSLESRKKMSNKCKGENNNNYRNFACFLNVENGIFYTTPELYELLNLTHGRLQWWRNIKNTTLNRFIKV